MEDTGSVIARAASKAVLLLCLGASCLTSQERGSALSSYALEQQPSLAWSLPSKLREISGLATSADGRVFAHDDEYAVIYQIDPKNGSIIKRFSLGSPPVRGDFEGIAVANGRFFLVTSWGEVISGPEGRNGEHTAYERMMAAVNARCDIEGLAFEAGTRSLLLACKECPGRKPCGSIAILRLQLGNAASKSLDTLLVPVLDTLLVPVAEIIRGTQLAGFHPSGIELHPFTGNYIIVAAVERAITEIAPDGSVVGTRMLAHASHKQTEGITFLPDGSLILSDEAGRKDRPARLSVYRRHSRR